MALALAFTDWALNLRPGVTEANVKRIRPGMTFAQVQQIFGGPPGERESNRCCRWYCAWYGRGGDAIVSFGEDGRVRRADWYGDAPDSSLLAHLRAWLGW